MKKIFLLVLIAVLLGISNYAAAEKPTQLYTPIIKQETYTAFQSNATVWTPTAYDSVVCNGYIISGKDNQEVLLKASDSIVRLNILASDPSVSPAGFLFKGIVNETIMIDTSMGGVSVTLTGWEED